MKKYLQVCLFMCLCISVFGQEMQTYGDFNYVYVSVYDL